MKSEEKVATTGTTTATTTGSVQVSPEESYVGSAITAEDPYPQGIRRRGSQGLLTSRLGYNEVGDEDPGPGDEDWMLEASQVSGSGVRGTKNWCLKICFPLLVSIFLAEEFCLSDLVESICR
ncbi:unnamed protein product [Choristocarpus tenellus]